MPHQWHHHNDDVVRLLHRWTSPEFIAGSFTVALWLQNWPPPQFIIYTWYELPYVILQSFSFVKYFVVFNLHLAGLAGGLAGGLAYRPIVNPVSLLYCD